MQVILLLPVLGLVYFAVADIVAAYRVMGAMKDVAAVTELAVKTSAAIHEMQKERGMTAGFLASGGTSFRQELDRQRQATDARLAALKGLFAASGERYPAVKGACEAATGRLARLAETRAAASSLTLAGKDSFAYYSGSIAALLDVAAAASRTMAHPGLAGKSVAYVAFLSAKEQVGRERATMNAVFTANRFDDETYRRFLAIRSAQDAYLGIFSSYATERARETFAARMAGDHGRQVDEMRRIALENHAAGNFGVDPKVWFAAITGKIDAMKEVEDLLSADLAETAAQLSAEARTDLVTGAVLAVAVILLAGVAGLLMVRSVMGPLNGMLAMLKDVAQGEGDLTRRLDARGRDELAEICSLFNTFIDKLHGIIARVAQNTAQVATAASQVYATSEQMATGAEQVASQSGTVATAGEEMAATSAEIAQNCVMAAEGAQHASSAATAGAAVVEGTVDVMHRIAERVKESARTVESLGSRSDQIGAIVGTIEDIADQTNLLALNAAIEAARAGEQGRGFAVVADEVRALAERTSRATREIAQMIKAIQQETRGAVSAMDDGVREVERGTGEAGKSGEALRAILDQINAVAMQVNQIATAAEQQTATTSEISSNMQQITEVVQQTARGAQESAAAASRLNGLAEELQRLVGQFRLAG
uniref:HAMP domain-containing protein n=1 Tax=Geobacter metallireducens TaxID=28232 RepID=A0A831XKJ2_GEOME